MLGKLLRGLRSLGEPATPVSKPVAPATTPSPAIMPAPVAAAPITAPAQDIPGLPFMIRPLQDSDLGQLAQVFCAAIDTLAGRDYDDAQRTAWASRASDDAFIPALQQDTTIVAEHHGDVIAFAQLSPATHLRMLYVHPDWASLGIATLMYQYLEDEARILGADHLDTRASHTAQRFFESVGFTRQETETVSINGVTLERHRMHKALKR